jgi:hypothetical protein
MDEGKEIREVIFDISKVFDKVWHIDLLYKLEKTGSEVIYLGEEVENVKVYRRTDGQTDRQTDGQTDDGQKAIRIAHLSFQLR